MNRIYLLFGLIAAFDLSTELGYFALAVIAANYFHKKMHEHKKSHENGRKHA